jgi:hypothetical protein
MAQIARKCQKYQRLVLPAAPVWVCTSTGISNFSPAAGFAIRFPVPPVFVAGSSVGQNVSIPADAIHWITRPSTAEDRLEIVVRGEDMPQPLGGLVLTPFLVSEPKPIRQNPVTSRLKLATRHWEC